MSLNHVVGEFSPHNLSLQAVLGLIGIGERITTTLAKLSSQAVEPAEPIERAREHPLDLALLGLLGLHAALLDQLERRDLVPPLAPEPSPEPSTELAPEVDALRRLLR